MTPKGKKQKYEISDIFLACYMHQQGIPNPGIRKRFKGMTDKMLAKWFSEFGVEVDFSVLSQADRIMAMLAFSSGTPEATVAKEFDIDLGVAQALKAATETQISDL